MPFTHHSHSGEFCNHAQDSLTEIVQHAFNVRRMSIVCLTEHIHRRGYLYPGEAETGWTDEKLEQNYDDFVRKATELQRAFTQGQLIKGQQLHSSVNPDIIIGFETEWIDEKISASVVRDLWARYGRNEDNPNGSVDYFVGSVHHVNGKPIDFSKERYTQAANESLLAHGLTNKQPILGDNASSLGDICIAYDYFEDQFNMLQALQPKIVGHFDLIRLYSDHPERDWRQEAAVAVARGTLSATSSTLAVWERIKRNLHFIRSYGGLLEINSSAVRKGLREPYPRSEICRYWLDIGGDFVLSDDSHGVEQVGTCYTQVRGFLDMIGAKRVAYLSRTADAALGTGGCWAGSWLRVNYLTLSELDALPFWATCQSGYEGNESKRVRG